MPDNFQKLTLKRPATTSLRCGQASAPFQKYTNKEFTSLYKFMITHSLLPAVNKFAAISSHPRRASLGREDKYWIKGQQR